MTKVACMCYNIAMSALLQLKPLNKNYFTIVDDEDFEKLSKQNWKCNPHSKRAYRVVYNHPQKPKYIYMHREITNCPEGREVDHINGNGLDNRKINLRIVTREQNMWNQKINKRNKSGYTGVYWNKLNKNWRTRFQIGDKIIEVGSFKDKYEAVLAYERKIAEYRGEFRRRVLT